MELTQLFTSDYDRENWLNALRERLHIDVFLMPSPIEAGRAKVEHFHQLGHVNLSDPKGGKKQLGIYEVKTAPNTPLHRNRVHMRNLVAQGCRRGALDGALAAYYNGTGQWRFSFISMEYRFDDQWRLNREESAPKRYTYLLGEGAQTRTVEERFSRIGKTATLKDLRDAFAVEPLNNEFFKDLFGWYERARKPGQVEFPNDENVSDHQAKGLIRFITRLLFVWFLKQKGLVRDELFNRAAVEQIIDLDQPSSYYKAILQNLFFATLNTKINKRNFRTEDRTPDNRNQDYVNQHVFRYHSMVQDETRWRNLFDSLPFLNGGLFECLDRRTTQQEKQSRGTRGENSALRMDGFSDHPSNRLRFPNELLVDENHGIITILQRYNFTVEESTPLDEDVALNPELLGRSFENLLASYNQETAETARKQTGSYYTPRAIVGYMVDESLKRYISDNHPDLTAQQLAALFAASDTQSTEPPLNDEQSSAVVTSINRLKVFDPAIGSGAFAMSMLQRLVDLLGILDPQNARWREQRFAELPKLHSLQQDFKTAEKINDREAREKAQEQLAVSRDKIRDLFNRQDHQYLRKLYLIKNCIYGADIQTIAIQICKLRFFITLAIEQQPNDNPEQNYGILPLPNLETKFVAADTLIALRVFNSNGSLRSSEAEQLLRELRTNRDNYFTVDTVDDKQQLIQRDQYLRRELVKELTRTGQFEDNGAQKPAQWEFHNQHISADWFNTAWMFGLSENFDIVIGNPPYIQLQKNKGRLADRYQSQNYHSFARSGDIYALFYERATQLLAPNGILCYITSNKWMRAAYGKRLREFFTDQVTSQILIDLGPGAFKASVDTNILLATNGRGSGRVTIQAATLHDNYRDQLPLAEYVTTHAKPIPEPPGGAVWTITNPAERALLDKITAVGTPLKRWDIQINRGIITGYNKGFIINDATKNALIDDDPKSKELLKPMLRGKDIKRYQAQWARMWIIDTHNGYGDVPPINVGNYKAIKQYLDQFYPELERRQDQGITPYNLRSCAYHAEFEKEKVVWSDIATSPTFQILEKGRYINNTVYMITGNQNKYLLAVLNSGVTSFYFPLIASGLGGKSSRYYKQFVEQIPVPKVSPAKQAPIIELVNGVIAGKQAGTDTTEMEQQIDQLVYRLYGLTEAEISLVEGKK